MLSAIFYLKRGSMKYLLSLIPLILICLFICVIVDKEGRNFIIPEKLVSEFKESTDIFKTKWNMPKSSSSTGWSANCKSDTLNENKLRDLENEIYDLEWKNDKLKRNLNNFRWNRDLRSFNREWRDFDSEWEIIKLKRNLRDIEMERDMTNLSRNKTLSDMNIELGLRDMKRDLNNLEWEIR
jgi:predicted RNase H-like nuclease (RuvC/YqgF family)